MMLKTSLKICLLSACVNKLKQLVNMRIKCYWIFYSNTQNSKTGP